MEMDHSKYISFGGRDPIIYDFSNNSYYQEFVNRLYDVWIGFYFGVFIKNKHPKKNTTLSFILPNTPGVHMKTIMEKYYITPPIGYDFFNNNVKRMSYWFFKECVTLLSMFQSDTTDPIKLYQKRVNTILKTYWTDDRWEKITKEKIKYHNDDVPPYVMDKGYRSFCTIENLLTSTRYDISWVQFEDLLLTPLDLAYNDNNELSLVHPENMIQQVIFHWIKYLHSVSSHPELDTNKLKRSICEKKNEEKLTDW